MKRIRFAKHILIKLLVLLIFTACLPDQPATTVQETDTSALTDSSDSTDSTDSSDSDSGSSTQVFTETSNFLQQGSERTTSTLSLFSDFDDTFLIRGNDLISFLTIEAQTNQNNYCIVLNYPQASGTDAKNILILSAKMKTYFSSVLQVKEYYLQVEPNNKTQNQTDCLTVSLSNKIQELYSTTSFAFSMDELCPNCNATISSNAMRLFSTSGDEELNVNIGNLFLSLMPPLGSSNSSTNNPTCSINSNCTSIGYNCCLSGQCVNHGSVRPEVDQTSDKYLVAVQQLLNSPQLLKNYEELFYVCPNLVSEDVDNNPDDPDLDPTQQANDLFTELTDIYNCLNPVIDEFSVCKLDYSNASELMSSSSYSFSAATDDLTFSTINASLGQNITKINYAGKTLYQQQLFSTDTEITNSDITFSGSNDNLITAQTATMQVSLPSDASNDIMSIYYKIDGTCEKLGSSLARCKKYYTQGQDSTPPRSSDHQSGNQTFSLPSYIDSTFNVIVSVGGSNVASGDDTWSLVGTDVVFDSTNYPIYDNQEIEITYFVTSNVTQLTASKEEAQDRLNEHCSCDPNEEACNLTPVYTDVNGTSQITSYACKYPQEDTDTPLQETVYISAKSVPHKFYDVNGVNYNLGSIGSEFSQEGTAFKYTDGNDLKPNNVDNYIGFNEIYGTMNSGTAAPLPPHALEVEKGTTYDLFVDQGAFSTCLDCGTDYYSNLQKVFPNNFEYKGAGYYPDLVESRRTLNQGDHAADTSRFGRACFVPATMIPWTHRTNSDLTTQRRDRLEAQHFLFANGYNKDWYGFDYGALIGSFDGVKWFAVGNQRRIKAESNTLYLAINGYFGDLTISNTFKVVVSEMTSVINSGSLVTHDTDNDGAQCQRSHFCSVDEDCITQLGYDYVCENVNSLYTSWPIFDSNGNETSGSRTTSIASLVGGTNGQAKRCVYRGQGAICSQQSQNVDASDSYTNSTKEELHACGSNAYCAPLTSSVFNDRISRYAKTPAAQNSYDFVTDKTDTFGLAARILGRPYEYYGQQTPDSGLRIHLANLNVDALCVPGKDVDSTTTVEENNYTSVNTREADKILNVGRTMASTILQDTNYLSSCPATDEDGDYTHFGKTLLSDSDHMPYAIKNNISSNSLLLDTLTSKNLFNDDEDPVVSLGYHKNTCLRAPGAKCFSDFECAPNRFISNAVKSISSFNGEINSAEEEFWEEELVCANSQDRYLENSTIQNPLYETYEHHCCRETNKTFTYYSQKHEGSSFDVIDSSGNPLIPGVNQDYNDPRRYSRTHTVYDKLVNDSSNYPSMVTPASQPSSPLVMDSTDLRQYNTLHLNNERMCCTGHWVRSFADENGGGHKFSASKQQNIDYTTFRSLSWNENNEPPVTALYSSDDAVSLRYTCTVQDIETADCEIKNIVEGSDEEQKFLKWYSKLELIGIPQVLVETNDTIYRPLGDNRYDSSEDNQKDISSLLKVMPNTIKDVNSSEGVVDATYSGVNYYSASSYDNFETGSSGLKKVYSESEFNCCLPTGVEVSASTPNEACCTGQAATINNVTRCCLNDFTDVSAYTNRYVSSEGAYFNGQKLSDSDIDPLTGYIKKEIVLEMASNMCCSGQAQYGKVIDQYLVPVDGASAVHPDNITTRRWMYLEDIDDAEQVGGAVSRFNAGVRWNNHVYCVPQGFNDGSNTGGGSGSGGSTVE